MTTTTTTPTFTDEREALAADLYNRYWGDVFYQHGGRDAHLPAGHAFLWAYEQGLAAQPGWREITRDEITKGMRVRVVPRPSADVTMTYEGIADSEHGGDWQTPEGWWLCTDPNARIFTPCAGLPRELRAGEAGDLPDGARFQVITTYQMGDRWEPEGDPTYRLLSLPEQPEPDPALVELIGEENARKVAAAGLVCEPRARQ